MVMREGLTFQDNSKEEIGSLRKKFDRFMHEHGHQVATVSTLARVPGGMLVAGLVLADRPEAARILHAGFSLTDGLDGWAARRSKRGPSKKWGRWDQRIDKFYSTVVEGSMVKKGHLSPRHFKTRGIREVVMSLGVRPLYERQGIDTSAVPSGKASILAATIADNFALSKLARRNPEVGKLVQSAATGAKIYSLFDAPKKWVKKDRQNRLGVPQEYPRPE